MVEKVDRYQKLEVKEEVGQLLKEFYEEVTDKEKIVKYHLEYPRIQEKMQNIQKELDEILNKNDK